MNESYGRACIGVAKTLVVTVFAVLAAGCGTVDTNGFLGLDTCDILNCDGLFFADFADEPEHTTGVDDAHAQDDDGNGPGVSGL